MKEQIKSLLRKFLNTNLLLCKRYALAQDLIMARSLWQQAVGAVQFISISAISVYSDFNFAAEIDTLWNEEYSDAFDKVLFPEVGE